MSEENRMSAATPAAIILVADDDPDLRDILRSVLEPSGFAVIEAENGDRALEAIRAKPPSLVILDYLMPGLTGPQVCEQLRQDVVLRHLPIIMLTGKSEVHDKVAGLNAGADDYLVKPFEPMELWPASRWCSVGRAGTWKPIRSHGCPATCPSSGNSKSG